MEIYQLRAFLAVSRHRHLTRAAVELHLTQPAVSKQIKALEEDLGVQLFERLPSGMVLTPEGDTLRQHAQRTLAAALALTGTARRLRSEVLGEIALGTIIDPETLRLGPFLRILLDLAPALQPRLQHAISGIVAAGVADGALDAGFVLGPVNTNELQLHPLRRMNYCVVGAAQWRDRLDRCSLYELSRMPWIGTPLHSSQHRLVHDLFAAEGLSFERVVEADQEATMATLAGSGVGLATMREDLALAAQARGELAIWRERRLTCTLSFIHRVNCAAEPAIKAALQAIDHVWPAPRPDAPSCDDSPMTEAGEQTV